MFQAGDVVIYGTTGVCTVLEITSKEFDGKKVSYYVLKPVTGQEATVFVPTENERLTKNLRHILTKEELMAFIRTFPTIPTIWDENEEQRKTSYRDCLGSAPREELIGMLKGVWTHAQALRQRGKKLHIADDRFYHDCEKIIFSEIAYVLGIDRSEVPAFLEKELGAPA